MIGTVLAVSAAVAVLPMGTVQARAGSVAIAYDVPAQSLTSALTAVARRSSLKLAYSAALSAGRLAPALRGSYTPEQAIGRLLSDSGLTYRFTTADTVTIVGPNVSDEAYRAEAAVQLDTIDVQGARPAVASSLQETAYGPGQGYVSHRSAAGTKTDTPLIETPQAVSVVTRDQIEQQGAQSVKQALNYTSGVAASSRSAFEGFDIIYSRGFVLDRYLDGLRLLGGSTTLTTPQIEPYGLERLDVLHGPASVLYGAGSPGGLVDGISKRPLDVPYHEAEFYSGNFGRLQGAFDLSGPVTQDGSVLYRLTGLARDVGSQVDFSRQQRVYIAPAVTWRPDGDTTLTLLATVQHDPRVGFYGVVPASGTVLPNPLGNIPRSRFLGDPSFNTFKRDQQSIGYLFEHRFDETWTVRQNMRFMNTDGKARQLLPLPLDLGGGLLDDGTLPRYALAEKDHIQAVTLDNEAEARFATGPLSHDLLLGIDYQHLSETVRIDEDFAPDINVFAPVYGLRIPTPSYPTAAISSSTKQVTDQVGLYAQDQVKFDRFVLTLSGREDWVNQDTNDYLTPARTAQDERAFTWRAGLSYLFDNGVAPYVSYATSFSPVPGVDASGAAFKPTTGQQYEGGIKFQPIGWNALFTLAAFDLTQQNVLTPDPANTAFNVQTGEVHSQGVELEAKVSLTDGLDVLASYTHADVKVTKSNDVDLGKRPVNVPNDVASLWAYYTLHEGWFKGLGFGGGVRYVGDTAGDLANTFLVPGYTVWDAALQYDVGEHWRPAKGLKLTVNATNLFDRRYVSECSDGLDCVFGNGRTILAGLKYTW